METVQNTRETSVHAIVKFGEPFRWKQGQSGNPGGRPRTRKLLKSLREKIEQTVKGDDIVADVLAQTLIDKALGGDVRALTECFDRLEGKPIQRMDVLSVHVRASWDRLNEAEMIAYAERGELPDWFELPAFEDEGEK